MEVEHWHRPIDSRHSAIDNYIMPFKELGLNDLLVQGILATGYTAPTQIQAKAIPVAVGGKDIIGTAKTGTGKTAAFVLPLLHRLSLREQSHPRQRRCRALILTPTRELAQQIEDAIRSYGRFMSFKPLAVYGGTNMGPQTNHLHKGVDILVATPGRLLDHMQRKNVDLSGVEVLVIDEADRMFDMGFINDVRTIVARTPKERQTMLFAATMSDEVRGLMSAIQRSPELIAIGERRTPAESVKQHFYSVARDHKLELLIHMLTSKDMDCVLVFSRTKHGADKVAHKLERQGISSVAIHSNRTQAQRQNALDGFKAGRFRVMVATDVAARGIDVDGISHVVNYDIPAFPEDYIHRIGRTGRASATGEAATFVTPDEVKHLRNIERYTSKRYELKQFQGFVPNTLPKDSAPQHARPHAAPSHSGRPGGGNRKGQPASSGHKRQPLRNDERRQQPRISGTGRGRRTNQHSSPHPAPAPPPVSKNDWRSLLEEMQGRLGKMKKKLKGTK